MAGAKATWFARGRRGLPVQWFRFPSSPPFPSLPLFQVISGFLHYSYLIPIEAVAGFSGFHPSTFWNFALPNPEWGPRVTFPYRATPLAKSKNEAEEEK